MTESERKHIRRMVKHAEKVRRNMENLRGTNKPRKTLEFKTLSKPNPDELET